MNNKIICMLILCSFFLTGCCTITRSPYQEVEIASNPSGAYVYLDDAYKGITPLKIKVERKIPHTLLLEKEGYENQQYSIESKLSPLYLSSNFLFPVTGTAVGATVGILSAQGTGGVFVLPAFTFVGGFIGLGVGAGIGVIGTGVDLYTGSARTLYPSQIESQLTPLE